MGDAVLVAVGVAVALAVVVGVTVADGVFVAVGVKVGVFVTTTVSTSYAPKSQATVPSPSPSCGRAAPRWSVVGQMLLSPASIAGLPGKRGK